MKYSATRSARASSSAEYCSLRTACGLPFSRSEILPDAWPITSCMLTRRSLPSELHLVARAVSSGDHENSLRNSGRVDLSYASLTFESETDLLPYCSRTC